MKKYKYKYMTGLVIGAAAGGIVGAVVESMSTNKSLVKGSRRMLRKAGSFISGMF